MDFTPLKPVVSHGREAVKSGNSDQRFKHVQQKLSEIPRPGSRASNISSSRASSRDGLSSLDPPPGGDTRPMDDSSNGRGRHMALKGSPRLRHKTVSPPDDSQSRSRTNGTNQSNGREKMIPGLKPQTKFTYAAYH